MRTVPKMCGESSLSRWGDEPQGERILNARQGFSRLMADGSASLSGLRSGCGCLLEVNPPASGQAVCGAGKTV
jgi:hypothetical protein